MSAVITEVGRGQEIFVVEAVVNPASMADGADSTLSVSLDGVGIGDAIQVVMPYDGQGMIVGCVASGEGSADLSFHNASGGTVDLASGTYKFIITRA